MMSPDHYSQLLHLESISHPFLSYLGKSLMIHFNKIKIGIILILEFHSIYCLSFCLKHEGMNYIVDNFKSSRIIWVTNMIVEKISNILVCTKKCLSKCKDKLHLTWIFARSNSTNSLPSSGFMSEFQEEFFLRILVWWRFPILKSTRSMDQQILSKRCFSVAPISSIPGSQEGSVSCTNPDNL